MKKKECALRGVFAIDMTFLLQLWDRSRITAETFPDQRSGPRGHGGSEGARREIWSQV
jgi:hypothetical protein